MNAAELETEGFEGHDPDRAYRRARRRAERKADLYEDLVKFAVVTGLLLLFVRPLGVVVMLLWGYKLFKRYATMEVFPGLRRRWIDDELRRHEFGADPDEDLEAPLGGGHRKRRRPRRRGRHRERGHTRAGDLVASLGDDPRADENVILARQALTNLDEVAEGADGDGSARETNPELRISDMHMVDVVESAVEAIRPRARASRVDVRIEADTEGPMRGDAEKLGWVLVHILNAILDAFEQHPVEQPRIEVLLGENLAATKVWVRIRDNGVGVDRGLLHPIARSFYEPHAERATPEFQIDFAKRDGRDAPADS
jgi:signal transduction histidine kinase